MNLKKHLLTLAVLFLAGGAAAQEALRLEIGKPLQSAQELLKAGKYKEALAKVREADAVGGKTPYESFILDRMRGSAAASAGDNETAVSSFESAVASGRLQSNERMQVLEALASTTYRMKDYGRATRWAERYLQEGGADPQMQTLLVTAHYMSGDFAGVVRDLQAKVQAAEQATPAVDEPTLQLLASSYAKLGDETGYAATLEKLVLHHPTKDYWADLLARVPRRPGFSDRYALDVYRLKLATSTLTETSQYVEMAQLSLQAGLPAEAKRVVEAGFAAGKLGVGPDANRHRRLRDLALKQVAEDEKGLGADVIGRSSDALVAIGQALAEAGRFDKGIELIESGIARGGLRHPDEARLHLGIAYARAGNKPKATATFKSVKGADGSGDLARLWTYHLSRT